MHLRHIRWRGKADMRIRRKRGTHTPCMPKGRTRGSDTKRALRGRTSRTLASANGGGVAAGSSTASYSIGWPATALTAARRMSAIRMWQGGWSWLEPLGQRWKWYTSKKQVCRQSMAHPMRTILSGCAYMQGCLGTQQVGTHARLLTKASCNAV